MARVHKVGQLRQLFCLFLDAWRYGVTDDDFYLFRFYLSTRRREVWRHFPIMSQARWPMGAILDIKEAGILSDKILFARQCQQAGLHTPPIIATFTGGKVWHPKSVLDSDLFSKPSARNRGTGTRLWRRGSFELLGLMETLRDQSGGPDGPILLQPALTNHPHLNAVTNGALSTLRIVTCKTLSGEIEFLPSVIKMPAGASIADNLAKGGLAAPIDQVRMRSWA